MRLKFKTVENAWQRHFKTTTGTKENEVEKYWEHDSETETPTHNHF